MHARVKTPIIGELFVEILFNPFEQLARVQGDPSSWSDEVIKIYGKPVFDSGNSKATLSMMRMVPDGPDHRDAAAMRKIEEYVKTLQIPVEIVWGMKDPLLGKGLSAMEKNFPDASGKFFSIAESPFPRRGSFIPQTISTGICKVFTYSSIFLIAAASL